MTPEQFLEKYENALRPQDWSEVEPLFHTNATVTFSNGTVHRGIEAAFKRNFSLIKSEEYAMSEVHWVLRSAETAVFTFVYSWKGIINGTRMEGNGVGTSVLVQSNGNWKFISEHLGKKD